MTCFISKPRHAPSGAFLLGSALAMATIAASARSRQLACLRGGGGGLEWPRLQHGATH
jgi:hypothetical protein